MLQGHLGMSTAPINLHSAFPTDVDRRFEGTILECNVVPTRLKLEQWSNPRLDTGAVLSSVRAATGIRLSFSLPLFTIEMEFERQAYMKNPTAFQSIHFFAPELCPFI